MKANDDDAGLDERLVHETLRSLRKRTRAARREYDRAVTRLWIGNAGGAAVTISYLGVAGGAHLSPAPLYFFLAGLVVLGSAAFYDLLSEWKTIKANQQAIGPLSLKVGFYRSFSQQAGFTLSALMACLAALCFVVGCALGFVELVMRTIPTELSL